MYPRKTGERLIICRIVSTNFKNTESIESYLENADAKTIAIGEEESVLVKGALMALVQEQKKIRIHINRSKLDENTVSFNARLLSLAKVKNY